MKPLGVIPCLITLGNAVCGFGAIYKISQGHHLHGAWLILLAMVFDATDGKVARLTKQTSDFGAQLDSLSDTISFGLAPALLIALMTHTEVTSGIWPKATWFFCVVFVLCAILRLARFNVEGKRGAGSEDSFRGLPSPAAAGMIATLVILSFFVTNPQEMVLSLELLSQDGARLVSQGITYLLLPAFAFGLGYLMVSSRIRYAHVLNRYFSGKRPFEYFAHLILVVVLVAVIREIALVAGFLAYVASGPLRLLAGEAPALEAAPAEAPGRRDTRR